ncbi:MAG: hypothetical protein V3U57_02755 [Robiginitomaculum sp.]
MSKKTLNAENLANLGAERLAGLLMEICESHADTKRRLKLELAHAAGPQHLIREVRKRLKTIAKAKGFIDWAKRKAFISDLEIQLDMITDRITKDEPREAFDLLWQFMELAGSVYERVDDSYGYYGDIFRYAITRFEDFQSDTIADPQSLALRVFKALEKNDYGEFDDLIIHISPALGKIGLQALKEIVLEYQKTLTPDAPVVANHLGHTPNPSDLAFRKSSLISRCLKDIADQQGDIDGYLAQFNQEELLNPNFVAEAANRLLSVDRNQEALDMLVSASRSRIGLCVPPQWDEAYGAALKALGKVEALQHFRWARFESTLSARYLREHLNELDDFDDVEREEQAKAVAMQHPNIHTALGFFLEWPDLRLASQLVLQRSIDLNGDRYGVLSPSADQLQGSSPLAAALVRRAMILYNLENKKTSRYGHTARHLLECQSADSVITDYGQFQSHSDFEEQLKANHGRKTSFWSKVNR